MSDLPGYLRNPEACEGERGTYAVKPYILDRRLRVRPSIRPSLVDLGHYRRGITELGSVVDRFLVELGKEFRMKGEFPVEDVAAFSILRQCQLKKHESGATGPSTLVERVGSYVIAKAQQEWEPVKLPGDKKERRPNPFGIVQLERTTPGMMSIYAIDLPTTPEEKANHEIRFAVRAHTPRELGGEEGWAVLHTPPQETYTTLGHPEPIERIITVSDIK